MRFTQLPVGESFEYQNSRYRKVGPLTAANLDTNQQRMIPRSALVEPLSGTATTEKQPPLADHTPDTATIVAAFGQYHTECLQWLLREDKSIDERREKLEHARQQFLLQCGLR